MEGLGQDLIVSTHSRPKAAGSPNTAAAPTARFQHTAARRRLGQCLARGRRRCRFNTQPPEGGWGWQRSILWAKMGFNTQPPEGGWHMPASALWRARCFNTQPPEGGWHALDAQGGVNHGFNTQPPEGGWQRLSSDSYHHRQVSTHSRPKAAGWLALGRRAGMGSFNTQPPEGGWTPFLTDRLGFITFQHTAARRRLALNTMIEKGKAGYVSTHSRPKAAGLL